jgi:hypothetical protein
VPVGGDAGQILAKIDGQNYNTHWINPQDDSAVWGQITGDLANQLDLSSALSLKLDVSTAALTYQPLSGMSAYLSKAGNLSGLTDLATARDNLQLGMLYNPTFAGLTLQGSGDNVGQYTPTSLTLTHTTFGQFTIQPSSGITFPDASIQTTAFPAGSNMPTGGLTGMALVKVSNDNYDAAWTALAPDYITSVISPLNVTSGELSVDLSGYATESWVQSQGYIASLQNLTSDVSWDSVSQSGRLLIHGVSTGVDGTSARLNFDSAVPAIPVDGDFWHDGQDFLYESASYGTETIASRSWVNAGVTFSGKTNFTSVDGAAGLNIGIGGTSANATVNGDIWIPTAGTNLNFRDGNGIARVCASTTSGNTFNQPQAVDTSNILPALRVTQRGTGNSLLVEDQTTPDTSALVVDGAGNVGIGVATGYTSTSKLEVVGNVKGTTLSTASGPVFSVNSIVAHTGGSDTNDLVVTIGGVNYRIGMRLA